MREILFRGKRTDNHQWVEGYYIVDDMENPNPYIVNAKGKYRIAHKTVGQYTGRKDKNGKRVFEGDILRLFSIWADGTVEPAEVPVIVQFWENYQCYVLTTKQGYHCDDFGNHGRPEYYEVIGNIYDNPELLEVRDE